MGRTTRWTGKTKRRVLGVRFDVHVFEMLQQRLAVEPRHVLAGEHNVVARERADRNEVRLDVVEARQEFAECGFDVSKDLPAVADHIHLVNCDDQMTDAEERGDVGMAARLRQQPFARIHQHDGEFGGRSARNHVARVLLVTGRVGNDELAARR